jgi:hypothetical protein
MTAFLVAFGIIVLLLLRRRRHVEVNRVSDHWLNDHHAGRHRP